MNTTQLPRALQKILDDATLAQNHEGWSGTEVFRVERHDEPTHYLKIAAKGSEQDLYAETARLLWLHNRLSVPRVDYFGEDGQRQYLLMTALPGIAAHEAPIHAHISAAIQWMAHGLRQIHAILVHDCPFDMRLDVKIGEARRRMEAGYVAEDDFDPERQSQRATEIYRKVRATRPQSEDLVFTHGDYCVPNIMLTSDAGALTGFIDWGRAGIADRYQDLALAARSIDFNFGASWVAPFFTAYGLAEAEIDMVRIAFYKLLDEFF